MPPIATIPDVVEALRPLGVSFRVDESVPGVKVGLAYGAVGAAERNALLDGCAWSIARPARIASLSTVAATPTPNFPVVPLDITREKVLAKCAYYTKVNLWPTALGGVNPRAWLANFEDDEERHAIYLLNAFLFFSTEVIDRVFLAACHSLSHRIIQRPSAGTNEVAGWNAFLDGLTITAVRGERPAATDSGALFTRRARHRAGFDKKQVLEQADAM